LDSRKNQNLESPITQKPRNPPNPEHYPAFGIWMSQHHQPPQSVWKAPPRIHKKWSQEGTPLEEHVTSEWVPTADKVKAFGKPFTVIFFLTAVDGYKVQLRKRRKPICET
jgi:hypothetical protein